MDGSLKFDEINLKFTYKKRDGVGMDIFFFRDFEIENQIKFALTLSNVKSSTDFSYVYTDNLAEFETTKYSKSFSIKPEITYSFSKYIDGNFYVNYSMTDSHLTGKKKETKIGFSVKIIFESFN